VFAGLAMPIQGIFYMAYIISKKIKRNNKIDIRIFT
jgi:hypothetical protein